MDSFRVPLGFHLGCHLRFLQGCFRVSFRVSLGFHIGFQFRVSFRVSLGCQFRVSAKVSVQVSSTSPHLCVGFLFLVLYPARLRPPASVRPPPAASHTTYTHTTYTHTHNLHTHTHNLLTHNLLTHNLHTHTTYLHTTYSHTTYSHTTYSHTTCTHTHNLLTHNLSTVSRGNFAWQAWHFVTSTFTLCGRCGTLHGTGLAPVARLGRTGTPGRRGRWRGRRGTWRHPPSFHVAGVALGDIDLHFCVAGVARMALGWLRWRAWAGVERRDAAAVGVAGVALRFTWQAWYLVTSTSTFAWQAWHVWHWAGSGGALGPEWNAGTPRLLVWQAWHLETSIFVSRGSGTWWVRLPLLRGRRGTYGTGLAPVARWGRSGTPGRRGCWRGRRGTWTETSMGMYLCCITCTFAYTVTCLCWMRLSYLRHL